MEINEIKKLDSNIASDDIYGKKISVLTELIKAGLNVPKGYYFSVNHSGISTLNSTSDKIIDELFSKFNQEKSLHLIARSSMSVENHKKNQFPGIFESIKGIKTSNDLKKAIIKCVESKESEYAYNYRDNLNNISLKQAKVAILVQEEIKLKYFGLAELKVNEFNEDDDSITIEISSKESFEVVNGKSLPSAIRVYREGNYAVLNNSEEIDFEDLNINFIKQELFRIRDTLNYDLIIEFGIDKNRVFYVFQAREHEIKGVNPLRSYIPIEAKEILTESKKIILEKEKKWGLKGAAMEYFNLNGLFEENLLLIDSEHTLTRIRSILNNENFCDGEITLRFSKGDEIGLKRFFTSNRESAFRELSKYYPDFKKLGQLLIIHPYLNVRHSYELLIDKDFFVLEHIPGLWEANNTLEPDVIYFDKKLNLAEILTVKEERQQIISSPFSTDRTFVSALGFDFFEDRLNKFLSFHRKLESDFAVHLPLNFHFVETEDGKIAFLNIRRLNIKRRNFESRRYTRDGSFFHVRNNEDLVGWDRKSPILLRLSTDRGKEKEFISLALQLPKNVDIYINFGWLSHPAMILREYGVNVIPAYLDRNIKTIKYEHN